MPTINLRDFYPEIYQNSYYIDVPESVIFALQDAERRERNYQRRVVYNKAYYSLDSGDGLENEVCFIIPSPYDLTERRLIATRLHSVLKSLPDKQRERVYACYILGMSKADIAKHEGVSEGAVKFSIRRGLANLKKVLKNFSF
jgi:RNA polymerase sigma-70 factor (ECF subfamily)